jgi:phage baseplate assembly protein W
MSSIVRKFSDLDLNFSAHPVTKDVIKKLNDNAIAGSIRNLLLTSHYERLFNPELGSNLKKMLFEPIDNITTSIIQGMILQTIKNYEPRVTIEDVIATPDYDNDRYDIKIVFFVNNTLEPITVSFFLERVR